VDLRIDEDPMAVFFTGIHSETSEKTTKESGDVGNFVNLSTDYTDFRDAVLFDLTPASLEPQSAQSGTRYTGHETEIYPQITQITQISTAQPLTRRGNM
jgi:hypothetical protein